MILGAFILAVALATSEVSARASVQYDLLDCRINTIADQTHHANDPNNCRVFYNCDNANGGKLTTCPEGTIYDAQSGLCKSSGDCLAWSQLANCDGNPSGMRKIKAQCCNTYFVYECASRTFKFQYCNPGEYFIPDNQDGGSCRMQQPNHGCDMCQAPNRDTCDGAGLVPVGPCQFKYIGFSDAITCAPGTKLNTTSCRCILDAQEVCERPSVQFGCGEKQSFNFQTKKIESTQAMSVNPASMEHAFNNAETAGVHLYPLWGQDLVYTAFALKLRLGFNSRVPNGETAILSPAMEMCGQELLKLDVKVSQNKLSVSVAHNSRVVALDSQQSGLPMNFNDVTLVIVFNLGAHEFKGTVNGQPMRQVTDNAAIMSSWSQSGIGQLCLPVLNHFSGTIREVSKWRGCTDFARLV